MNTSERCPNGCPGHSMIRHDEGIALHFGTVAGVLGAFPNGNAYGLQRRNQVHEAWYKCTNCERMYVSSVFKRFKRINIV